MSDSWIKMRTCLLTSPKVIRVSVSLGIHPSAVCGACFAVWAIADTHSSNGRLPGYTYTVLDQLAGVPGLCRALETVGWAKEDADGVTLPQYGIHNGSTAKSRATAARRASRKRDRDSQNPSRSRNADTVTKGAPELEKRREEKKKEKPPAAAQRPPSGGGGTARGNSADTIGQGRVVFRLSTREFEGISDADLAAWAGAYPAVDVPVAIRQAAAWVWAERASKGRKSNYERFLASWFKRDQDRGGGSAPRAVAWGDAGGAGRGVADEIAAAERARDAMLRNVTGGAA